MIWKSLKNKHKGKDTADIKIFILPSAFELIDNQVLKKQLRYFCLLILLAFLGHDAVGQHTDLVQLSGLVVSEDAKSEPVPLPFAEVRIKSTNRGVYANESGFFSIAVDRGDTLQFRYIGYKEALFVVPVSLVDDHYTVFQILTKDEILLPETFVYPWPRKEHFKQEFLQMDVTQPLRDVAEQNLAQSNIRRMLEFTVHDGQSNASYYLSQEAQKAYYMGQFRPMRIMDPGAWIEFFKAWKRGDFKIRKNKYE